MNHLEYKLQNLMNDYCEPLYDYNQYILKRFFEYAFDDEEYVKKVLNGSTGLHKTAYCPQHEKVIMTACITALHKDNTEVYKEFYSDYLTFKTSFSGWRGRGEWFDFHRTVLSHFIWTDNMYAFHWTWEKNCEYMKNFKKKYPKVSDWRRRWYIQEIGKLKLYILRVCAVSERLSLITEFIDRGIVKINKEAENMLLKFGYELKDGKVINVSFVNTNEWSWLHEYGNKDVSNVDVDVCVDVCRKSHFNKSRLIDLFVLKGKDVFWNFFLKVDKDTLTFVTCKAIIRILSSADFQIENDKLKRDVIFKIFELRKFITKSLIFSVNTCLNNYKLSLKDGIVILKEIFDEENVDDYSYLATICEFFISSDIDPNNTQKLVEMRTDDLYWLYTLLGRCIQSVLNNTLRGKKEINLNEPCAICLCNMTDKDVCCLPCGHCFHKNCILKDVSSREINMTKSYSCPMCRSKIHIASIDAVVM